MIEVVIVIVVVVVIVNLKYCLKVNQVRCCCCSLKEIQMLNLNFQED